MHLQVVISFRNTNVSKTQDTVSTYIQHDLHPV